MAQSWDDISTPVPSGAQPTVGWNDISTVAAPRTARGFLENVEAAIQSSVGGLLYRQEAPTLEVDPEAGIVTRTAASLVTMAGDIPAMVPGFVAGAAAGGAVGSAVPVLGTGVGAAVGGGAGAMAAPAVIREFLIDYYRGEDISASRLAKTGGKEALIGALTFGVGGKVARALPIADDIARAFGAEMVGAGGRTAASTLAYGAARGGAIVGSEVSTMVGSRALLEWRLPEPQEFLDAAVLIGGIRGTAHAAGKLQEIYRRNGTRPEEVARAARDDINLQIELIDESRGIPERFATRIDDAPPLRAAREPTALESATERGPLIELPKDLSQTQQRLLYNLRHVTDGEQQKALFTEVVKEAEAQIELQRRGHVPLSTSVENSRSVVQDLLGQRGLQREPGTPASDAEILARGTLLQTAVRDVADAAHRLAVIKNAGAKGNLFAEADPVALNVARAEYLAAKARLTDMTSEYLGATAEIGRAMRAIQHISSVVGKAKDLDAALKKFGEKGVDESAALVRGMTDARSIADFARQTRWHEKGLEYWKAGLVSGPETQATNVLSNLAFLATRLPRDAIAASLGKLRPGEKVLFGEIVGEAVGAGKGFIDGSKLAWAKLRMAFSEETPVAGKAEVRAPAIEGTKGKIIRLPFVALEAGDVLFKEINERMTLYALSTRAALRSGDKVEFFSGDFWRKIEMEARFSGPIVEAARLEGQRYTFTAEGGRATQALQNLARQVPAFQLVLPFIRTPANIFKETTRMTPLAPFLKEVRAEIKKGGAARDKALADMAMGAGAMLGTWWAVDQGYITGGGSPDPDVRRTQLASGFQPYSFKLNGRYYSYQRLEPLATLLGLAADLHTAWAYATEKEKGDVMDAVQFAFTQQVTNKSFLQGFAQFVGALGDFEHKGRTIAENLIGSFVIPNLIAQTARVTDPVRREKYDPSYARSILNAIIERIPVLREGLPVLRDAYGEPIANDERLWLFSPIRIKEDSTDPVRAEMARLRIGTVPAPKRIDPVAGPLRGEYRLSAVERDFFAEEAGQLAYSVLKDYVGTETWRAMPDELKRIFVAKVFRDARSVAMQKTIPIEERRRATEEAARSLIGKGEIR